MLEKTQSIKLDGEEYQVTRVFEPDLKAQETFWKRYFMVWNSKKYKESIPTTENRTSVIAKGDFLAMAGKILLDSQKKECKKVVKYEKCNSLSAAQH